MTQKGKLCKIIQLIKSRFKTQIYYYISKPLLYVYHWALLILDLNLCSSSKLCIITTKNNYNYSYINVLFREQNCTKVHVRNIFGILESLCKFYLHKSLECIYNQKIRCIHSYRSMNLIKPILSSYMTKVSSSISKVLTYQKNIKLGFFFFPVEMKC